MEFKGTKGKWTIQNQGTDSVLKNITCREYSDWFVAESILYYDAKLIAAAPELLKALQLIKKAVYEISMPSEIMSEVDKAINKALN